jgi:ribosomal protein L15
MASGFSTGLAGRAGRGSFGDDSRRGQKLTSLQFRVRQMGSTRQRINRD